MHLQNIYKTIPYSLVPSGILIASTDTAFAHEAWLLTPAEIVTLAAEPIPFVFTSHIVLGMAAMIGCIATALALRVERHFGPRFQPLIPTLQSAQSGVGPAVLRIALGLMLILAGTGGLPRHGTAPWTEPTLLVPDMQLSLLSGWDWLAPVQIVLGLALAVGLFARVAGLILIAIVVLGLHTFGIKFVDYAPHFLAPAMVVILTGAGTWSADKALKIEDLAAPPTQMTAAMWRGAQIFVGLGFVYLAVAYKLTQPTLLIAILQHSNLPTFGLPYSVIALIMTWVEIICGTLLIAGRMVRFVSLVIIGAITFLAVTLGETPFFHANLYGVLFMFFTVGKHWPTGQRTTFSRKAFA